jgi:tripartite-type tricarboxylate transporter receptor subunit TctC
MKFPRRQFLHLAAGAAALQALSRSVGAQTYPTRPITLIVPYPAGSDADAIARLMVDGMRASLGQSIVIENIGGAEGSIGLGRVARARPDGYTIDFGGTSAHVLSGALYSLQFDLLNDFAPILPIGTSPLVLFARGITANDVSELIAWLRANPNKASAGIFSGASHVLAAFFQRETKTQFVLVPYRGSAPAVQDLAAGQIDLSFAAPQVLPQVRAGSIRAYAVTSETRLAVAPDLPTFGEMGLPALSFPAWFGFFAPKDTPTDMIGKLNAAGRNALNDPVVQSRLTNFGYGIFPPDKQTPEFLGALVKADAEKWWPIIKALGIKAQ